MPFSVVRRCQIIWQFTSFAHAIIRDIFGFQPDGATPTLANPTAARGTDGVLDNVAFGGHLYRITSDRSGLHVSRPDER